MTDQIYDTLIKCVDEANKQAVVQMVSDKTTDEPEARAKKFRNIKKAYLENLIKEHDLQIS